MMTVLTLVGGILFSILVMYSVKAMVSVK